MSSETDKAFDEFVQANADFLQAERSGSASLELRTRLAEARANAKKLLTIEQYDEAVFKAFRIWMPS
jgi:hypothetical protein